MMRIGYLPSDFNPMILMLGEAEDCRALGGVLRRFSHDGQAVDFAGLGFCRLHGTGLRLAAASGHGAVEQTGARSFVWRLPAAEAAAFADRLDDLAGPGRLAGREHFEGDTRDGIAVAVSRGEYTDDFLA